MTDRQEDFDQRITYVVELMHRYADKAVADGLLTPEDRELLHVLACDAPTWQRLDAAIDREMEIMQGSPEASELLTLTAVTASSADFMCENCVTPWKCNGPHNATVPVG